MYSDKVGNFEYRPFPLQLEESPGNEFTITVHNCEPWSLLGFPSKRPPRLSISWQPKYLSNAHSESMFNQATTAISAPAAKFAAPAYSTQHEKVLNPNGGIPRNSDRPFKLDWAPGGGLAD